MLHYKPRRLVCKDNKKWVILVHTGNLRLLAIRRNHVKSSKIKKNLDYLGLFIDILLVVGKNPCSLVAKL